MRWGPVGKLWIHDNRIEQCCCSTTRSFPAISVDTSHRGTLPAVSDLHGEVRIERNCFVDNGDAGVYLACCRHAVVRENGLLDGQVQTVNCGEVIVEDGSPLQSGPFCVIL